MPIHEFRERFNTEGTAELTQQSAGARTQLLRLTGMVMRQVLSYDLLNRELLELNGVIDHWVIHDDQAAPTDGGELRPTMSFMLEGHPNPNDYPQRLRIHMPRPPDFEIDADERAIEALPDPTVMYAERILMREVQQNVGRFAIAGDSMFSYQSAVDTQTEEYIEGQDYGPDMWAVLERRVDSRLPILTGIYEDMVNWNLVPQRRSTANERRNIDL